MTVLSPRAMVRGRHLAPGRRRKLLVAWLGLATALLAAMAGLRSGPVLLLEGVLFLLLVSPAVVDLTCGTFDLFELRNLFCLGYFVQFLLSTWYSHFLEYRFVSESFFQSYLSQALSLAILGLLAYYAGYHAKLGSVLARKIRPLATEWRASKIPFIVAAFVVIAVISWIIVIRLTGGLVFVLTHLNEITELVEGKTFLFSITAGFFYAAIVVCDLQGQRTGSRKYKIAAAALALINLAILLTRGYKFPFAMVAVVFWVSRHYLRGAGRRTGLLWKVLIAIAVLALVPYYQLYRGEDRATVDAASVRALDVNWGNAFPLVFRRYYGIEAFELILSKVPQEVPHAHGWSLLLFFTYFVPRALWADKPLGPGDYEVDLFFNIPHKVMTGVEPSLPGELYWNFGVAGIVVGMAALGLLCRLVYALFQRNHSWSGLLLYIPWVFWGFECNDGNLSDGLYSYVLIYLLPVFLAYVLLARRRVHHSLRSVTRAVTGRAAARPPSHLGVGTQVNASATETAHADAPVRSADQGTRR